MCTPPPLYVAVTIAQYMVKANAPLPETAAAAYGLATPLDHFGLTLLRPLTNLRLTRTLDVE